jgi:hypothetical protein
VSERPRVLLDAQSRMFYRCRASRRGRRVTSGCGSEPRADVGPLLASRSCARHGGNTWPLRELPIGQLLGSLPAKNQGRGIGSSSITG